MAADSKIQVSVFFILALLSLAHSQPRNIVLPVTKDKLTSQYITQINLGTPPVFKSLVVDLAGRGPWIDCEKGYTSSTYKPALCGSEECSSSRVQFCFKCTTTQGPGCTNASVCSTVPVNSVTGNSFIPSGEVASDRTSFQSFNGAISNPTINIPKLIFSCAPNALLEGLAAGSTGMVLLDASPIGLPNQLSARIGSRLPRKFAICLPSQTNTKGVVLFGNPPYNFHTHFNKSDLTDLSRDLTYTKLTINPDSTLRWSSYSEYFLTLKSILVNKAPISINQTLLTFNRTAASGGTILSTAKPYTVLESSIYKSLASTFSSHMSSIKVAKTKPIAPFTECYSNENLPYTISGPSVPEIGFKFADGAVYEMVGYSAAVEVAKGVVCLAFVDGVSARDGTAAVVIGARQMEDVLLQFDLTTARLGFSRALIEVDVACENFKF